MSPRDCGQGSRSSTLSASGLPVTGGKGACPAWPPQLPAQGLLSLGRREKDRRLGGQGHYVSPVLRYLRPGPGGTWGGAPVHVTSSVCLSPRPLSPWCPHPTLWKQKCRSHWGLGTL